MAKNIFEKKKRVARVKGLNNEIDSEDVVAAGVFDYVSSIIQNMDSNFQLVKTNSFNANHSETKISNEAERCEDERDSSAASTTKNGNMGKLKKFVLSRKFPLMEKSQKVLKQLKHNQSIPKQRAHLSSMPNSPAKKNIKANHSKISCQKKDMYFKRNAHQQISENLTNSNFEQSKSLNKASKSSEKKDFNSCSNTDGTIFSSSKIPKVSDQNPSKNSNAPCVNNYKNSVVSSKKSKALHEVNNLHSHYDRSYFRKSSLGSDLNAKRKTERSQSNLYSSKSSSVRNSDISSSNVSSRSNSIVNDKSESNVNNSSANETTDAEYEKFVKKSKKGLRQVTKKKKTSKRSVQKLRNMESSDDDTSSTKCEKSKKRKVSYEKAKNKPKVIVSDESDFIDEDIYTRDSSSESDRPPVDTISDSHSLESKDSECYGSLPKINVATKQNNIMDDDVSSVKCRKNKKMKVTHENFKTAPEAELMDGDIYTRYSSSENNIAPVDIICGSPLLESKDSESYSSLAVPNAVTEDSNVMDTSFNFQTPVAHSDDLCGDEVSCDGNLYSESSAITGDAATNKELENESPEYVVLSSPEQDYEYINPNFSLNLIAEFPNSCVKSKESTLIARTTDSKEASLPSSTIDLKLPALSTAAADSEESDIEVVDVILKEEFKYNQAVDTINNSTFSNEKHLIHESCKRDVPTKEALNARIKIENEGKKKINKVDADDKHEAVYTTDICNGNDAKNSQKLPQIHSNVMRKIHNTSENSYKFTNRKIKKEDSDDDVMIIPSVEKPVKHPKKKLSREGTNTSIHRKEFKTESSHPLVDFISQNKKCQYLPEFKVENPITKQEKRQTYLANEEKPAKFALNEDTKLSEVTGADFPQNLSCEDWNISEKNLDVVQLIDLYKQEFQTYRELIKVETNFEAKIKRIENKHAQKLLRLRALIKHKVSSKQTEAVNNSKIEASVRDICNLDNLNLDNMKYKNALIPNYPSKLFSVKSEYTRDQNAENVSDKLSPKFLTSTKDVPISFSDKFTDEKPVLSRYSSSQRLEYSLVKPKIEPVSPEESTEKCANVAMKLLGEKCCICRKNAVAACLKCAKIFFCSNECGVKSWNGGHKDKCGK